MTRNITIGICAIIFIAGFMTNNLVIEIIALIAGVTGAAYTKG